MWLKGIVEELKVQDQVVTIHYDNSAIQLSKNQVYHERMKHIDVKLHFVREEIARGSVKVTKVSTNHNLSNMITKVLSDNKFFHCLNLIQLMGD